MLSIQSDHAPGRSRQTWAVFHRQPFAFANLALLQLDKWTRDPRMRRPWDAVTRDARSRWNVRFGSSSCLFQGSPILLQSVQKHKQQTLSSAILCIKKLGPLWTPGCYAHLVFHGSVLECTFPKLVFPTVSIHSRNKGDLWTVRISPDPCFSRSCLYEALDEAQGCPGCLDALGQARGGGGREPWCV